MVRMAPAAAAMMLLAGGATAQVSVGNSPGGTLAPATGTVGVGPSTPSPVQPGDFAHVARPELAAAKYKTEIVCKTSIITGSLVAKKKTCLTRRQWDYVDDENQRNARDMVAVNTTK